MYQLKQVPSEAQIRKFVRQVVFGKNAFCPACRSQKVVRHEMRYRCRACRCKFSLLSHTWLKDTKLPLQTFWLILWSWTNQIPVKQTAELTNHSAHAIYHWFDLFRSHLPENPCILGKIVQLDEAFFREKTLMLGKEQGTRKLAYEILNTDVVSKWHACYFLQQHVKPGSTLRTDGGGQHKAIDQRWPVTHEHEVHKRWEFALTSEIEGMFGNFRTFVRRMYHHVTSDKLPEIVREFCIRFSLPEIFENPRNYLKKTLSLVPID